MKLTPILVNAVDVPHGKGTKSIIQDLKAPIRANIRPVEDSYHVIALPQVFNWSTLSVAPTGSATIYFTISSPEAVRSGTAVWHEWGHGTIIAPAWHEWENPWMALRVDCDAPTLVEIATKVS